MGKVLNMLLLIYRDEEDQKGMRQSVLLNHVVVISHVLFQWSLLYISPLGLNSCFIKVPLLHHHLLCVVRLFFLIRTMGIRLPQLVLAKKILKRALGGSASASGIDIPKGHFAVYVGKNRRRFLIPTSYLKSPTFQELLNKAEEEYGFHPQMGLTIPCSEGTFRNLTLQMR